jgi:hypothetical protein
MSVRTTRFFAAALVAGMQSENFAQNCDGIYTFFVTTRKTFTGSGNL